MQKSEVFTFRVNSDERRLIAQLAERLQRNQSDAVRLVIREAAVALLTAEPKRTPANARHIGTGQSTP